VFVLCYGVFIVNSFLCVKFSTLYLDKRELLCKFVLIFWRDSLWP
jgi:hypothetical protein